MAQEHAEEMALEAVTEEAAEGGVGGKRGLSTEGSDGGDVHRPKTIDLRHLGGAGGDIVTNQLQPLQYTDGSKCDNRPVQHARANDGDTFGGRGTASRGWGRGSEWARFDQGAATSQKFQGGSNLPPPGASPGVACGWVRPQVRDTWGCTA